jgi:D-alanyl-D-alanine carboxypeptidase
VTRQDLLDEVTGTRCAGALATVVDADGTTWTGASQGLDPSAVFRSASNTKTFTAVAVLRLVEQGRLALDQRVGLGPGRSATVEQLLRHTSGLPDHATDPAYVSTVKADPARTWTREEQVARGLALPPVGPAGGQVSYSDTGYVLLGGLLEEATGRGLGEVLDEVCRLAGLEDTWLEDTLPERRAPQRFEELDVWSISATGDLYGGGGLVTTTRDLAGFYRALLDGRLLGPETLALMLTSTDLPGNERALGMGIYRTPPVEGDWWGHTGFWNTAAGAERGTRAAVAVCVLQQPVDGVPAAADLASALVTTQK